MTIKSKQAQQWLAAYNASKHYSVEQAYVKPSVNKITADRECQRLCQQENGYGYKIISAGVQFFTAAWMTCDGYFRVETACNTYKIKL